MYWHFMPASQHYDGGFGIMADSFLGAADLIDGSDKQGIFSGWQLTVCFMRRHAVELYLKSLVVIASKRFDRVDAAESIMVEVDGGERRLTSIHHTGPLLKKLRGLFDTHAEEVRSVVSTDWWEAMDEAEALVRGIDELDRRGTFYRYPDPPGEATEDKKSDFQRVAVDDIAQLAKASGKPSKTLLVLDENDEVVDSFMLNWDMLKEERELLKKATDLFSAFHFGLRAEISGGR